MRFFPFVLFFIPAIVIAQQPKIMILRSIYANDLYLFEEKNMQYFCSPYGVLVIDNLLRKQNLNDTCKQAIQSFIQAHPKLFSFAHYELYLRQGYHVEYTKDGCLIFSSGKKTFSERMLEEGIAIKDPAVSNEEYDHYFFVAQQNAKKKKKGVWNDPKLQSCITELLKKE